MGFLKRRSEVLIGELLGLMLILSLLLAPPTWNGAGPLSMAGSRLTRMSTGWGVAIPELGVSTDDLPAGASASWWSAVQEDIRRQEYGVTWQSATYLPGVPAAYQAPNRAHNLRTYFLPEGVRIIPRTRGQESWEFGLALSGFGSLANVQPLGAAELIPSANRIAYRRSSLFEQYINDERGVTQRLVVQKPPCCSPAGVVFRLSLGGDLVPALLDGGTAIQFSGAAGVPVLLYRDLRAVDATGRVLPARFAVDGSQLTVHVDGEGAAYPITVDASIASPGDLSTTADWTGIGNRESARYGISVSTAGDVNGDGYSDVIVGAFLHETATLTETGKVYAYYGSPTGLSTTPDWSVTGDNAGARLGYSVSTAGDVDGDGYADVIVGAYLYSNGHTHEGAAFVYRGSPTGLHGSPAWSAESNTENGRLGISVGTAGDVDGNGCSDVIVGAYWYNTGDELGAAYVWEGSSGGLGADGTPNNADWSVHGQQPDAGFGRRVGTAGDVNGDGYADVIVGAAMYKDEEAGEGRAYVYHGSASGLNNTEDWFAEGDQINAYFGCSVSTAGDVNGDGYADVIVGAYGYNQSGQDVGRALVYHGSASGLSATDDWHVAGTQAYAELGVSVSTAGDVNGDGFGDVIIGEHQYTGGLAFEGRAHVYYGSGTGLGATSAWSDEGNQTNAYYGISVNTAGDVNGDGYSDIIVGAPGYVGSVLGGGAAFVYHGAAGDVSDAYDWSVQGTSGDSLGCAVNTAGDVNGDGYADVIVGASGYDSGHLGEGAAYVYLGGPGGLVAAAADWSAEANKLNAKFGSSVSTAGDVNGDGYDDVLIGAEGYHVGVALNEGAIFIWYGSFTGLGASGTPLNADWKVEGDQGGAMLGASVSTAGDVNGDGYADVVAGAPGYKGGDEEDEGIAYVYYGSGSGPSTVADWDKELDLADARFGSSVSTAGDVNGDGYADIIIGAPGYTDGEDEEGGAFVYYGSATGLNSDADWSAESNQGDARFGFSVSRAGDVNGDGYSDVIVGAPYYTNGEAYEGGASVYHGSANGLSTTPNWMGQGDQANALAGYAVSTAGDVNGDGYADIIVGVPAYDRGQDNEGLALIYYGAVAGLSGDSDWFAESDRNDAFLGRSVAMAGDVNGDGYADVIVGADGYSNTGSGEGAAFLYYGNGGDGMHLIPHQLNTGAAPPIALWGMSGSTTVKLRMMGRSPLGREDVKMEWQLAPLGEPYTSTAAITGTSIAWTDVLTTGVSIDEDVAGLSWGLAYHWRARLLYEPGNRLGQSHSRWVYGPAVGGKETCFRTPDGPITNMTAGSDSPTVLGNPTTLWASADQHYVDYAWDFGDGDTGSGAVVEHTYAATGTYRVVVTGTNTVSFVTATTAITVDYAYVYLPLTLNDYVPYFAGPWEVEDNDSASTANGPLISGQDYYGYPNDRDDYFSLYVPTGGTLTIDLTGHTGQGVQVQLFYQTTDVLVTYDWTEPYHIEYTGSAGWYYIRIYTESGYGTGTSYTLNVTYP